MSELMVTLDNRVRLVGAVLAGSQWPQKEQVQVAHAVHPQAKLTRQFVADYAEHPAIHTANSALRAGTPVTDLFAAALNCAWPTFDVEGPLPTSFAAAEWIEALADFYVDTAIAAFFWATQAAAWEEARRDLATIHQGRQLPAFLVRLAGHHLPSDIHVVPNLTYPALKPMLVAGAGALVFILPPPKAIGESAPWPYHEGVDWVLAETCYRLCAHILRPTLVSLTETEQATLLHAAVAIFLGEALGQGDSQAYIVSSKRQFNLPHLPQAATELQAHLATPTDLPLATLIKRSTIQQFNK